jgi:hypothetical protein
MEGEQRQEVVLGDGAVIFSFDRTVLEIFGDIQPTHSRKAGQVYRESSTRIHLEQLEGETKGPDRKGRYELTFRVAKRVAASAWKGEPASYEFELDEAEWNAVQPLLDTLRSAGVELS